MPAYKDEAHGTFYASFYYTDFTGTKRKKMKRGFKLKRDALEWERQFLLQNPGSRRHQHGSHPVCSQTARLARQKTGESIQVFLHLLCLYILTVKFFQ